MNYIRLLFLTTILLYSNSQTVSDSRIKELERTFYWLSEKIDRVLMNNENLNAYLSGDSYFKVLDDLDGDDIVEIYLYNKQQCTETGCNFKVYRIDSEHQQFTEIFDKYDDTKERLLEVVREEKSSWKSIKLTKCDNLSHCTDTVYKYSCSVQYYQKVKIPTTTSKGYAKSKSTVSIEKEHDKVFYEKGNHTIVDIIYGTDRKINHDKILENYYSGERGKLKYGVAQVSIPKEHESGKIERPGFYEKEKIGEHVVVVGLNDISKEEFTNLLSLKLSNVSEKDILIFIHGFNVTFASAIRRTAQLSYDLKFKGVPMTYSWPSAGEISEYMKDETTVQYTTPHLVTYFKDVIENSDGANIHVIGHSMGTRALTNALKELSFVYPNRHLFKNIILAAPDIDKDVFKTSLFPYIRKTTEQVTLYASSDDTALELSKKLHGYNRIGQGGDDIAVFEGLTTVDATGIDTSLLGHSYFAEKEVLVGDLKEVIIKSLPPTKRSSLIEKMKAQLAYWEFKMKKTGFWSSN